MSIEAVKRLFFLYLDNSNLNLTSIIRAIVMMALVTIVIIVLMLYLIILSRPHPLSLLLSFHPLGESTTFSLILSISLLQIFCIIAIAIVSYSE